MQNQKRLAVILITTLVALAPDVLLSQPSDKQTSHGTQTEEVCIHDLDSCLAVMRERFATRGVMGCLVPPPKEGEQDINNVRWEIVRVVPGTAADEAGLRSNDVIVLWDGMALPPGDPGPFLRRIKVGQKAELTIMRNSKEHVLHVVARKPDSHALESWLMEYVYENYNRKIFEDYRDQVMDRLSSQRR